MADIIGRRSGRQTRNESAGPAMGGCIAGPAASLCALLLALPSAALANGYEDLHQSAQGLGTAYAVNGAGITDISAMFSNPASLSRFEGSWASMGASAILPRDSFDDLHATAPYSGAPVTGTPAVPKQFLSHTVGASFFLSHQLSKTLVLGAAFTVPWATRSTYPATAVSRYTAIDTNLRAYNFNPVLSWSAGNGISIAAGPTFQLYTADFSTAVDPTGGIAASASNDIISRIKARDFSVGVIVGAEWQLSPATRIGISYRSGVAHNFDGTLNLTSGNPNSIAMLDAGLFAATGKHLSGPTGRARFKINTPSLATFGITHAVTPDFDLYGSATLVGWHLFRDTLVSYDNGLPTTIVDNDWHDSWYVAIGAGYRMNEKVQLRTGIAYDWTPTPHSVRNPRAPNADRIYAGVGLTYQTSPLWKLDVAYNHCFFKDAPIDLAGGNNVPRGTLHGISRIDANIFMAQFTVNIGQLLGRKR